MNSKNQKVRNNKILLLAATAGLLATASIAGILFYKSNSALAEVDNTTGADKPAFVFDNAKAPGWWSGGNNWPDIKDFTGGQVTEEDLAVASISVGQGKSGEMGNCFVDYSLQKQTLDSVATAVSEMEKRSIEGSDDVTLNPLSVQAIKINTPEGQKEYQLHQYEVTGAGSTQRAKGVQFGYLPLKNGYIEVRSSCNEAIQLNDTLSALKAVRLAK